jgi:molybdenum cofactor cytidylyltransferase
MLTASRTALILLAAGQSRRFEGGAKLLQPFKGRLLVDCALDLGRSMDFALRVMVARADLPALAAHAAGYSIVANDRPEAGMGHSLKLGVDALAGTDVDACLVLLADMPFVDAAHLEALFAASETGLVASEAEGVRQPPALFAARYFPALAALEGDSGARDLLRQATSVAADREMLTDIDTVADIAAIRPGP